MLSPLNEMFDLLFNLLPINGRTILDDLKTVMKNRFMVCKLVEKISVELPEALVKSFF